MRDPKVIVEQVQYILPIVFTVLLAPISISLISTDRALVSRPDAMDPCRVDSLDRLFMVVWMTFFFGSLTITLSLRVRHLHHFGLHACGAWISLACARVLGTMTVFFTLEANWKRYTCLAMGIRLLMWATVILAVLAIVYDTYICLVEDDSDSSPSASAAPVAHEVGTQTIPDSIPLYRYVREGERLEQYAKEERKRNKGKAPATLAHKYAKEEQISCFTLP